MGYDEVVKRIAQELADQGKLIEAGWQVHRSIAYPEVRNVAEIDRLREAFENGAAHLFFTMMAMMDAGEGETEADVRRMENLHDEVAKIDAAARAKFGDPLAKLRERES